MTSDEAGLDLPGEFVGVWARESIRLGDAPAGEHQEVRYLQARRCYADLRLDREGSGAMCFAGVTTWEAPWLRWRHDLDLEPRLGPVDQGEIEWLGRGRMAERGSFTGADGVVAYEEVWVPLPAGDGGLLVLRSDDPPARLVQIGGHALVVADARGGGGGFAARYDVRTAGGWAPTLGLGGVAAALPTPPDVGPASLAPGDHLDLGGLCWTVEEIDPALPAR